MAHAVLHFVAAILVPGPEGQRMPIPAGVYRVPLGKLGLIELQEKLAEAIEMLPDPKPESKLQVVGDMGTADRVAAQAQAMEQDLRGESIAS